MTVPIITIDGPSGAGKSTISQLLANQLQWHFLDSGALYRAVAFKAKEQGTDLTDEIMLAKLASQLDISFAPSINGNEPANIIVDDKDITIMARSEQNGIDASKIAIFPTVRQALVSIQRDFATSPGLIADGRDMGTKIFSYAPLKCFLTASIEARAKRRLKQLHTKGIHATLRVIINDLEERDTRDKNRKTAPLKPATDAMIIDTSAMSIAEVLEVILTAWQKKAIEL